MTNKTNPPWASGPGELLRHGLSLLQKDNDSNRRIAMICIDNSVELMIKTFLGLPKRITGIQISRKDYSEMSESFPKLLDGLEQYAADKIKGIDLGEIEWFHRLRNELYHQGNGLTVERTNVEVYAEIANLLFLNLFGFKLIEDKEDKTDLLGKFMNSWIQFERMTKDMSFVLDDNEKLRMPLDAIRFLHKNKIISDIELHRLDLIRKTRNEIVHGLQNHEKVINEQIIKELVELTQTIKNRTLTETK
ncbi:MAG: hypothetical protein WBM13_12720 [Bacteroidia bacterium]